MEVWERCILLSLGCDAGWMSYIGIGIDACMHGLGGGMKGVSAYTTPAPRSLSRAAHLLLGADRPIGLCSIRRPLHRQLRTRLDVFFVTANASHDVPMY